MNRPEQLDCVMPAAGLSSRMGCWKMMLPYRHHTVLDESIENALRFCSRVILVVGHRADELVERYAEFERVLVVVNTDYRRGMFSSIQCGVNRVEGGYFFICHGDMPCIDPAIYRQVWSQRGAHTVFPGTAQKPGHPVLLPASLITEITRAQATDKMKRIIFSQAVKYAGLGIEEIHLDVDTPEAYFNLCQRSHLPYQIES